MMKYFLLVLTYFFLALNSKAELTNITNKAGKTIKVTVVSCDEETVKFTIPSKSGVKTFNMADLSEKTQEDLKLWKSQGKEFSNDLELVSYKPNKSENKTANENEKRNRNRNGNGNRNRGNRNAKVTKEKSFTISPKLIIGNRDKYRPSTTGSVYVFIHEGGNTPLQPPLTVSLDSIPPQETIELETQSLITTSYKGYALFITNSSHEIIFEKGSLHGITKKCNEKLTAILKNKTH